MPESPLSYCELRDRPFFMDFRRNTTLVTGASAGLGREIARVIAEQHAGNLVIVARRADRLSELAEELRRRCGVEVTPLVADLSVPSEIERCFTEATTGRTIQGVILNAGVTYFGRATEQTDESVASIISTNVSGVVGLSTRFARYFVNEKIRGGLMMVSSMASLAPFPYQAVYAGTKAFITSFALALREELRENGIPVTVFCPAGIASEMLETSGLSKQFQPGSTGIMDADVCARYAVDAFGSDLGLAIPGPSNWIASMAMRAFPRTLVARAVERIYRGGIEKIEKK
jgi:uncharacterized protein